MIVLCCIPGLFSPINFYYAISGDIFHFLHSFLIPVFRSEDSSKPLMGHGFSPDGLAGEQNL
jgi:hypothetical protein